jgi:hypothetical protein
LLFLSQQRLRPSAAPAMAALEEEAAALSFILIHYLILKIHNK